MSDNIQVSLRLSPALHSQLAEYAKANNLSLNGVVIQAIQALLKTDSLEKRVDMLETMVAKIIDVGV